MVGTEMYIEIQKCKQAGYSQRAVSRELDQSSLNTKAMMKMNSGTIAVEPMPLIKLNIRHPGK